MRNIPDTAWKVSNTEFFLVRIFPHSDWIQEIRSISPYSVRMRENTNQKKLRIWTHFTQWETYRELCQTSKMEPFANSHLIFHNKLQIGFWIRLWVTNKSSSPEVFLRKGVLKICSKFTREHSCRSVISINLLWYIALRHGCFSCKFATYFQNIYL